MDRAPDGGRNWTPELIARAGGVDVFGVAGVHSPWITFEQLLTRDPDVIVIAPCGFDLERTRGEMHWLTERPEWPRLKAVRAGRVWLADGNQLFNRPGPRIVETFEVLRGILGGGVFPGEFVARLNFLSQSAEFINDYA